MKVKYVRYSSSSQSPDRQLIDIQEKKYDKIYIEQVSGCIPFSERIEGSRLLADIITGKVKHLHIDEISRLGRNTIDTLKTIQILEENNVSLVVENLGLSSHLENGSTNPIFKLVSTIIATIAEQERECIAERLDAGRIAARSKGVKFGRKTGSTESHLEFLSKPNSKQIIKLLAKNYTIRDISKQLSCSVNLVLKVKKLSAPVQP